MKASSRFFFGATALGALAVVVGQLSSVATAVPGGGRHSGSDGGVAAGADLIVGSLSSISKWGTVGGISAYSISTSSCNIGTEQLLWYDFDPDGAGPIQASDHPVTIQNAYRVKNGRVEQIGMSWARHGICALQQAVCHVCDPAGTGCPNKLGIGCGDPYDSAVNGQQSILGPRSQVNASTGAFPYPWSAPAAPATIGRRCQIPITDLDPALNAGAAYYFEGHYLHAQDAGANNDDNNATHRGFTVGSLTGGAYTLTMSGSSFQQLPAIYAWKSVDPLVEVVPVDSPDGRFHVAYRVTDNGNGTWHYEYAIHNMDSDASGSSFEMDLPPGIVVTNQGFRDIAAHSGEPYNSIDWAMTTSAGVLRWSCTETFATNPNANALRFGTMYNFWFDANSAPQTGTGTIGRFKTGGTVSFTGLVLGDQPFQPDCNGNKVPDVEDIAQGMSQDIDSNGTPDECQTVHVPSEFSTIQFAIDDAPNAEMRIIAVAAGTYAGPFDFKGKPVIVRGASAATTILNGTNGQTVSVVQFSGGEPSIAALEHVTVRGGTSGTPFPGSPQYLCGGGIFMYESAGHLRHCIVENNVASFGGGAYLLSSTGTVSDCVFRNNTAATDGGGMQVYSGNVSVSDTLVEDNACNSRGGGLHLVEGTPDLLRVIVRDNHSANLVGGVSWAPSGVEGTFLAMDTCEITGNTAAVVQGGFAALDDGAGPRASLLNTTVCDNTPLPNASGLWNDLGGNTICECTGDVTLDGTVNGADLGSLLGDWGEVTQPTLADLNHDGVVNGADLGMLLGNWGPCTK